MCDPPRPIDRFDGRTETQLLILRSVPLTRPGRRLVGAVASDGLRKFLRPADYPTAQHGAPGTDGDAGCAMVALVECTLTQLPPTRPAPAPGQVVGLRCRPGQTGVEAAYEILSWVDLLLTCARPLTTVPVAVYKQALGLMSHVTGTVRMALDPQVQRLKEFTSLLGAKYRPLGEREEAAQSTLTSFMGIANASA